jgi:hypothetical protein
MRRHAAKQESCVSMKAFRFIWLSLALITAGTTASLCGEAQQKVHIENLKDTAGRSQTSRVDDVSRLEAESIEITPGGAIPAAIHRPAGKFIVLLTNNTQENDAVFVVDAAVEAEGAAEAEPLLRLADAPTRPKHRMAGLIELPPGEFDLKSAKTSKVLCRFTIE